MYWLKWMLIHDHWLLPCTCNMRRERARERVTVMELRRTQSLPADTIPPENAKFWLIYKYDNVTQKFETSARQLECVLQTSVGLFFFRTKDIAQHTLDWFVRCWLVWAIWILCKYRGKSLACKNVMFFYVFITARMVIGFNNSCG